MSRPRCCRRISFMPRCAYFKPYGLRIPQLDETVILTRDELEAIRLKDYDSLDQDTAAEKMGISQSTFSRMIESARQKISDSITNGKTLRISYDMMYKRIKCCLRDKMKIAIASDDGKNISQHFGRAEGFKVYDVENGKVLSEEYRKNIGKSNGECHSCNHAAMIENIKDCKFVISNGMGQRIFDDLTNNKITPFVTDEIVVDEALSKFILNSLENKTSKLH